MGEIGLMKNSITISLNVVDSLIKLSFKAFQHFSIKSGIHALSNCHFFQSPQVGSILTSFFLQEYKFIELFQDFRVAHKSINKLFFIRFCELFKTNFLLFIKIDLMGLSTVI